MRLALLIVGLSIAHAIRPNESLFEIEFQIALAVLFTIMDFYETFKDD